MSLILNQGSVPHVEVKTHGMLKRDVIITIATEAGKAFCGEGKIALQAELTMSDFCSMVEYVMTNTDLDNDDPRIKLVDWIKSLQQIDGYSASKKRLGHKPPTDLN